jgi:hypothetical protein
MYFLLGEKGGMVSSWQDAQSAVLSDTREYLQLMSLSFS